VQRARELYLAFAAGDRPAVEGMLSDDVGFSSPVDVGLDRAGFFARCWPDARGGQEFSFVRLIPAGEEVIVTYELTRADVRRARNAEVLTFRGDRICAAEVYFGWDLE
jgi:hypothetical protein